RRRRRRRPAHPRVVAMRLLRLDLDGRSLELHPYVSVVRALDPADRAALVAAVAGLAAGEARADGLLEAHGVLLPLDGASLDVLDLTDLDGIDPVIGRDDFPGARAGWTAVAERRRQVTDAAAALET